ncbi:endonuclease/exonuclease/phosphatase family protein [Pseudomonadota bacterium]
MLKTILIRYKLVTIVVGAFLTLAIFYLFVGIARPAGNLKGTEINPPSQWQSGKITTFDVGTYNIHRAKGVDGVRDIARIAKAIEGLNIVALQEVGGPTFLGMPNQVQQLGGLLDIGWLFAPTSVRFGKDKSGTGLLSQFKVNSWRRQQLDSPINASLRNYLVVKIAIGNKEVVLINTHIHTGVDGMDQLKTVIGEFNKYDVAILAGDLNTRRQQSPLKELLGDPKVTDAIKSALGREPPEWNVDWILTRGLRVVSGKHLEAGASDHPLYSVKLSFLE